MIFRTLIHAFLAGIALGIAGTVNLSVGGGIPGAFLFGFGLFLILCFAFKLYTGAIGYLVQKSGREFVPYLGTLLAIWVGNFAGTAAVGMLVRQTRIADKIVPAAQGLCAVKLADSPASILILAFFCGILMFSAVDCFRREEFPPIYRMGMVFLCVMIFILSGFEHCIANMYYFSASGMLFSPEETARVLSAILLMTLGNSLGGWFFPLAWKIAPAR